MGSNANVEILSDEVRRYVVRIMDKSPNSGMVLDKRDEEFLIINCNQIVDGQRVGCGTLVFEGDLPTVAEIRDSDLMVEGIWGVHKTFGGRFEVHGWMLVDRPKEERKPAAKKTRRLDAPPSQPKKPRTRRLSPRGKRPAPSKADIESTNDWYSQSGGMGDSLDDVA